MSPRWATVLALVAVVVLVVGPLLLDRSGDSEFAGVDAEAVDEVRRIDPDHEPWATPLWSPPGTETESLLFALQAAVGAGAIGYIAGSLRTRSRLTASADEQIWSEEPAPTEQAVPSPQPTDG